MKIAIVTLIAGASLAACATSIPGPVNLDYCYTDNRLPGRADFEFSEPMQARLDAAAAQGIVFDRSSQFREPGDRPRNVFPEAALRSKVEGFCFVMADLDAFGKPSNLDATCTHPIFEKNAKSAVSRAKFPAETVNGVPTARDAYLHPISYCLHDDDNRPFFRTYRQQR